MTAVCAVLGAPEALMLHRMGNPWKSLFLLVVLGPLLISVVARTLGWALLFGSTGLVNKALVGAGLVATPVQFMYTETGVVIALTHVLVPFMVHLGLGVAAADRPAGREAAVSLGASEFTVLRRLIVPQAMPGILSGSVIVFALAASAFATPAIIGGRRLKVIATLAYDEFLNTLNWPLGASLAVLLLAANVVVLVASQPADRAALSRGVPGERRMSRNGPLAYAFHALFIAFMSRRSRSSASSRSRRWATSRCRPTRCRCAGSPRSSTTRASSAPSGSASASASCRR